MCAVHVYHCFTWNLSLHHLNNWKKNLINPGISSFVRNRGVEFVLSQNNPSNISKHATFLQLIKLLFSLDMLKSEGRDLRISTRYRTKKRTWLL